MALVRHNGEDMTHPDRFLLAGVMGFPVMHSRSPRLHNYWLAQHGLAGAYLPLAIKAEGLRAALRALPALGFSGCNLTIPHKEAALAIVDRVDPVARRIGAINCVVVAPDGSLEGQNHDAFGYIESIREAQPGWRADAGPVVVVGAGGGARAVLVSLIDQGAPELRLVNRTFARAATLERELGGPVKALPWEHRQAALDTAEEFGYPLILKPTLGAASNFVFRIDGPDELRLRFPQALDGMQRMSWFTMEPDGVDLGPHGLLVESPEAAEMAAGIDKIRRMQFNPLDLRNRAATFSAEQFRVRLKQHLRPIGPGTEGSRI